MFVFIFRFPDPDVVKVQFITWQLWLFHVLLMSWHFPPSLHPVDEAKHHISFDLPCYFKASELKGYKSICDNHWTDFMQTLLFSILIYSFALLVNQCVMWCVCNYTPFVEVETAVGGMLFTSIRDAVHDLCGIDGQASAHSVTATYTLLTR